MADDTTEAAAGYAEALKRIAACRERRDQGDVLHLNGLGLTTLPPEIGQLKAVKELHVCDNQLTTLPPEVGQLKALTELDLSDNRFTTLPPEVGQLKALTTLSFVCNLITKLPLEIRQLKVLTDLSLAGNHLTTLPPEIGQLKDLTRLSLNANQLTTLPPEIGKLNALTILAVGDNLVTTLPPEIGQLNALAMLYLTGNRLTTLPSEIGQLNALTDLSVANNHLTNLPSEIGRLKNLMTLSLGCNHLTTLPPEIGQLKALTTLSLELNHLTTLPSEIGQLTALTTLSLGHNHLTTLPPEIGQLKAMTRLDFRGNLLMMLPPEIRQLTALQTLNLHDNSGLGLPGEILVYRSGLSPPEKITRTREILDYYFTHRLAGEKEGTEPLMEAKVLFLGEPDVGKTCLLAALAEGKTRHALDGKGTSGIVRKLWSVRVKGGELTPKTNTRGAETLRLNCWDFGGQEIYRSAHTLFLTHRAIYLVVVSKRDNERQNNLDYWLRMATSFGGPDAVIYVVVNKDDEPVGHPPDEQALRRKYPQIRGFLRTSCDDLTGIQEARAVIVREALHLDGVRVPVAKTWLAVKKKLEEMEEPTLSLRQWAELCGKNGLDKQSQGDLLYLCDRLGTVRYFPTTHSDSPELCDTAILNPEWVTRGIYAVLDDPSLEKNGGILNRAEMTAILKKRNYPVQHERIIEEIMRQFDLLFDSSDHGPEHRMLVPLMLPESEPKFEWPAEGTLEFVYQYEVIPAGLVPAFMARRHENLSKMIPAWRHGCVLKIKNCQVRVIGDAEQKRILISVTGPETARRDALDQVRLTFESLHGSVINLPVLELIPVPGYPQAPMLDYQFVRSLEWQGESRFKTKGTNRGQIITVDVREALDGVRGKAKKQQDEEQGQCENEDGRTSSDPLAQYVTLDQMAARVHRSKKTLEKKLNDPKSTMPPPDVEGGGGKPHEWIWANIRPWLEKEFGKKLPLILPNRRADGN